MPDTRLGRAVLILGALLAAVYLIAGLVGAIFIDWDDDDGGDSAFWIVFLVGGALVLVAGLLARSRSRWLAVALLAIGAIAGAVVIFWSVLIPLAALVLIVLAVLWAREPSAPAH